MDEKAAKELELYAQHLEALRAIEADRTANLMSYLDKVLEKTEPKKLTDEERHQDLRQYFAAHALGSILQDKSIWDCTPDEEQEIAARMFRWADAMMKARLPS